MHDDEIQRSAGGVVLHRGRLLLIETQRSGQWQLPKGHLEPGETPSQAAVREVREETGAAVTVLAPAGRVEYRFRDRSGRWIEKQVDFFLCAFAHQASERCDPREVRQARWHPCADALELLAFDNERELVRCSIERLEDLDRRRGLGTPDPARDGAAPDASSRHAEGAQGPSSAPRHTDCSDPEPRGEDDGSEEIP